MREFEKNKIRVYLTTSFLMLTVFLLATAFLFYAGEFLYAKILNNGVVEYKSGLAQTENSILTKDLTNFKLGLTPIPSIGKTIVIDTRENQVHLFEKGELFSSFALDSKPADDSAWEISSGQFSVVKKEEKHLSPISKLYFPYAIQFADNALLHGVPTDNSDHSLVKTKQGGFRLSNERAAKVFAWADLDTKVFVYGVGDKIKDEDYFSYKIKKSGKLDLSAEAYLVADLENKEVILSQNKDEAVPIASITKLMTALVSLELIKPQDEVVVSSLALATYGNSAEFKVGDKLTAQTMLYPLLLESSNDAAEALAESVGREKFLARMNQKATELGMESTYFEDPSGLSPNNVSSAEDLLKLIDYTHKNHSFLLEITKLKEYKFGRFSWFNRNSLVNMKYYAGGKNGYTDEANRTLVSLFDLPLSELKNRPIVLVLLGSENRQADTKNLINYLASSVIYDRPASL